MAFQVGEIKISGTIDGLSFYNSEFGWLVRRKGGPSPKQFRSSPAFARARENSSEFTLCSRAASSIRKLVLLFLKGGARKAEDSISQITDKQLYHRLLKLMRFLANADQTSPRGQRDPLKALLAPTSLSLLKNFHISNDLNLYTILVSTGILQPRARKIQRKKIILFNYRRLNSLSLPHHVLALAVKRNKFQFCHITSNVPPPPS